MPKGKKSGKPQFSLITILAVTVYFAVESAIYSAEWGHFPNHVSILLQLVFAAVMAVWAVQEHGKFRAFCIGCLVPTALLLLGINLFEFIDSVFWGPYGKPSELSPRDTPPYQELVHVRVVSLCCGLFAYVISGFRFSSKLDPDQP